MQNSFELPYWNMEECDDHKPKIHERLNWANIHQPQEFHGRVISTYRDGFDEPRAIVELETADGGRIYDMQIPAMLKRMYRWEDLPSIHFAFHGKTDFGDGSTFRFEFEDLVNGPESVRECWRLYGKVSTITDVTLHRIAPLMTPKNAALMVLGVNNDSNGKGRTLISLRRFHKKIDKSVMAALIKKDLIERIGSKYKIKA